VLDTPDPWALAGFWAALVGGTPVEWYDGWVTLEPPPHGQRLSFQRSQPPDHGADGNPAGVHVDLLVEDLDAAHQRVLASGGVFLHERSSPRPAPDGEPVHWRVFADPDGHRFCLVVR
jgi:hypothetical protein